MNYQLDETPGSISEKQLDYLTSLLDSKDLFASPKFFDAVNAMDEGELAAYMDELRQEVANLSKSQASKWIDSLKELPYKGRERSSSNGDGPEPEVGMYQDPDTGRIIRVYLGQQSGRNLAKLLVNTGRPHPEDPDAILHEWEYLGLAAAKLPTKAAKLTLEEAKEYGKMTRACCRCGRRLDVPESVEAGIGPVCAGKVEEWA